jgi:hypothetical protein
VEIDVNQTVLIVVGMDIGPEEADRPLAYKLKTAIESTSYFGDHPFRKCLVISDALAGKLVEELPVYLSKNNKYFIQLNRDFKDQKIAIWGMDRNSTAKAIDTFMANGILKDFLKAIWG